MHTPGRHGEYLARTVRGRLLILNYREGTGEHESSHCVGMAVPFVGGP